ncbi:MAG: DUF559 domain-containing protein [Actinomycetota bacterium]
MREADRRCIELARRQFGVIARSQALDLGISTSSIQRRLSIGSWSVVFPTVYSVSSLGTTLHGRLKAATLWCPRSAVSHRAAAGLHGILNAPNILEIAACDSSRRADGVTVHYARELSQCDVTYWQDIPVTTAARTLADLGAVVDEDRVEEALDLSLRVGLVSLPRLRWQISRMDTRGRKGVAVLSRLLAARPIGYVPTESPLEARVLGKLRAAGLPEPVRQFVIRADGKALARVDFAYPAARLTIEVDGYAYHHGREVWKRDLLRRNAVTAMGWQMLHVTDADCRAKQPAFVDQVRRCLDLSENRFDFRA